MLSLYSKAWGETATTEQIILILRNGIGGWHYGVFIITTKKGGELKMIMSNHCAALGINTFYSHGDTPKLHQILF